MVARGRKGEEAGEGREIEGGGRGLGLAELCALDFGFGRRAAHTRPIIPD